MSSDPDSATVSQLVALFNDRRYAETENQARFLADQFPDSGLIWKVLGAALQVQGKNSLSSLQKAAELLPEDADAHSNLGVALKELSRLDEAVGYYRRALEIKPDYAEAHSNLGTTLRSLARLDGAVKSYCRALEIKPNYTEAHYNLGNVLQVLGQPDVAVASYRRALGIDRRHAEAHYNLGNALLALGQPDEAVASYRRVLDINHHHAEASFNLGNTLLALGQLDDAVQTYRQSLRTRPDYVEAHNNLGNALRDIGQFDCAVTSYLHALAINPDYVEARSNLGNALQGLRRFDEAVASYDRALRLDPEYAEAHSNLGSALRTLGRLDDAVRSYQRALATNPAHAAAQNNLGNAQRELGQLDSAATNFRRAMRIKPDYAEAHSNLGAALADLWQLDGAASSYRSALAIKPDFSPAHTHLAKAQRDLGQLDDAIASCRRALEIDPGRDDPRIAALMLELTICPNTSTESLRVPNAFDLALAGFSKWLESLTERPPDLHENICSQPPFYLAYRRGNHVERLSRYGDLLTQSAKPIAPRPPGVPRERLRLAVVSRHFRNHSVWHIITRGLLENLDRQKFELVLYHLWHSEDDHTAIAKSLADHWRDLSTIGTTGGWLGALVTDGPDIILYPEIGMDHRTLSLATQRLAPLQAVSWGHPITTGLPTIDLFFSGQLLEPADADKHYRERLVKLPGTGCCTRPIEITPRDLSELEPKLALRHGTRFVIAQMPFKFDPSDDILYTRIAAAVSDSVFILLRSAEFPWATDHVVARLSQSFREHGLIPETRLLVIPWLSREKFYALLDLCDIYLDCPSFSGYTTAWQALHQGLPVVTLEGRFMRQRLAAGLLRKIGLTETIAGSADHYVAIAARLAEECMDPAHRHARRSAIELAAREGDNDVGVVRAFEKHLIDAIAER